MTEFLTLNQRYIEPSRVIQDIWLWFLICVNLSCLFYGLTVFVQWVIDRFFTVTDRDYREWEYVHGKTVLWDVDGLIKRFEEDGSNPELIEHMKKWREENAEYIVHGR